jgi:hypothetical protein
VGAYAVEYVRQRNRGTWDIKFAVERACKASASVIQKVGCQLAIPWADELDQDQRAASADVPKVEVSDTVLELAQHQIGDIKLEENAERGI